MRTAHHYHTAAQAQTDHPCFPTAAACYAPGAKASIGQIVDIRGGQRIGNCIGGLSVDEIRDITKPRH